LLSYILQQKFYTSWYPSNVGLDMSGYPPLKGIHSLTVQNGDNPGFLKQIPTNLCFSESQILDDEMRQYSNSNM
jgi:hypothetical protein